MCIVADKPLNGAQRYILTGNGTRGNHIANTKIITHSFSGKGCPHDNACIESFHASLKKEEVHLVNYFDYDAARLAIFEYIESWYNRKRIHGSIGYITPQECEDLAKKTA